MSEAKASTNKIGLWAATSLVTGNMIGSGVFMLPAALAMYGAISLFGWIVSSVGAVVLAIVFKNLSHHMPHARGGPYAFAREGLGEFPGFLVAWGYWISTWCTNAAISVAIVSYLTVFFPVLATNQYLALMASLALVWFLTWVNTRPMKWAGAVQLWTTIIKLIPLLAISICGLFYIDWNNFATLNISTESNWTAITASTTLTLFAFLGLECATIPAGNIEHPEKTIPRATIIGTGVAIIVYILASFSLLGLIPALELQKSNTPFADAAALMWGDSVRYWVAGGAIISAFGALNGWILMQGQIPAAAALDNIFPKIFKQQNTYGMPVYSLVISSVLVSILISLNFTKGFAQAFQFIILLSTLTSLLPYLLSTASYLLLMLNRRLEHGLDYKNILIASLAFVFSFMAIVGSGQEIVYWGFLLLLSGIPFYIWVKKK